MNETRHCVVIVGCAITAQLAAAITAGAAAPGEGVYPYRS